MISAKNAEIVVCREDGVPSRASRVAGAESAGHADRDEIRRV